MKSNKTLAWVGGALAALTMACAPLTAFAAAPGAVIPAPAHTSSGAGAFALTPSTPVFGAGRASETAAQLAAALDLKTGAGRSGIVLALVPSTAELKGEGYRLRVTPKEIRIEAPTEAGLFYGAQTLRQLAAAVGTGPIPAVDITDAPRFAWRGVLIDVARHFYSKEVLMRVMDQMAYYKLNVLHLHLTDYEGWRFTVPDYPKLTEGEDGQFYGEADIKALVTYAQARHITIVPEIETPAHSGAAATAYPQFYDAHHNINPANPESYKFLTAVFTRAAELFPSPYLHFGGDELGDSGWDALPEVEALRKEKALNGPYAVEGYFDRRVAEIIRGLGRTPMAWDEAQSAGVSADKSMVIEWWRKSHPEARDQAVQAGADLVLSPVDELYLDYPQAYGEPGAPWEGNDNGPTSLAKILAWEPIPAGYSAAQAAHIRGVEASLWTEFIQSEKYLQFMLFPRLLAVSEVAWSPAGHRDRAEFEGRLQPHIERLRAQGVNARRGLEDAAPYLTH
jgi:hexosaminidase